MNYAALGLIVISSSGVAIISHIRKAFQVKNGGGNVEAFLFVTLSSLIGAICGFVMAGKMEFTKLSMLLSFLYAAISTVTAVACIVATQWGNITVLILFADVGTLVLPSVYGFFAFPAENSLSPWKVLGFVFAFLCIFMSLFETKGEKSNLKFKLVGILIFFTNGSALIVFDAKCRYCSELSPYSFVAWYMLFSVVLALIVALCIGKKNFGERSKQTLKSSKNFLMIAGYGSVLFLAEVFSLRAVEDLPLIIQAPLSFSIPIVIVAVVDYLLYKEKITGKNIVQFILATLSCACFCLG